MALAYLCSQLRRSDPDFKISDNPVSGFRGMVVDHRLRNGSHEEALAVCDALREMNFIVESYPLNWSKSLGDYGHPKDLPNFESVARTLRYRKLGLMCAFRNTVSLLLAHHEDDQYETVLMRLLQGHGSRGLRGMRKAHDIPECQGLHGVDRSGYVDDQRRPFPYYNTKPTKKQRKVMHRELRSTINRLMAEAELKESHSTTLTDVDLEEFYQSKRVLSFEPHTFDVEDGGVTMYRPLLEFSKDRLIATCLENNVPWWEDATNKDPTLTMRNAVRHLYKGYTLPNALQKPAILALSKRCERRTQAQEAEANRLLSRTIIHEFETYAGTVTVQFPNFEPRPTRRDARSPLRRQARLSKRKETAAILMRKILMLVSPDSQPPLLTTLENHVARLFPSLADPQDAAIAGPPKAFMLSGVYLVPIEANTKPTSGKAARPQLSWYLSRAPYPSTMPPPRIRQPYWAAERNRKGHWRMSPRMPWALWDGRYWIHVEHRFPHRMIIQPFLKEHAKPFRELLTPDDRNLLAAFLKRYAPGKVRYTLPAIYLEEPLDLDLSLKKMEPRPNYPIIEEDSGSLHPKVLDNSKMKLVALPTLDIQIPNLDKWMSYEIRYRKADRDTRLTAGSFHRGSFVSSLAVRRRARKGMGGVRGRAKVLWHRRVRAGARNLRRCLDKT